MQFLPRDEAKTLEKKLRHELAAQPKLVLYYDSGERDYAAAANAIAASAGDFSTATLLYQFCVSGDGWSEGAPPDTRWDRCKRWRAAQGEARRLYKVPGHRFARGEAELLSNAIVFALELGWDALLAATPKRQLLLLSHDDRMEIYRGFDRRALADRLTSLGYWRRASR
jgi:hypothetical protein